jgi:hypothetical protein
MVGCESGHAADCACVEPQIFAEGLGGVHQVIWSDTWSSQQRKHLFNRLVVAFTGDFYFAEKVRLKVFFFCDHDDAAK